MAPETPDPALSHTVGRDTPPLLGETIGDNLDATVTRVPDREALVDAPPACGWTYAELGAEVDAARPRPAGAPASARATGSASGRPNCAEWVLVQYATAKVGAILVNINPAYRTHELTYVLNQAGIRMLVIAPSFKTSDYVAMVDEVRGELPRAASRSSCSARPEWERRSSRRADAASRERLAELQAELEPTTRSTSSTRPARPASPRARRSRHHNILNNGYFVGRGLPLHRAGPGLHPGALLPLLRHGHGQPRGHHARRLHGHPGTRRSTRARPCRPSQEERCTSLYGVPTMFIAELGTARLRRPTTSSSLRTGIMAGSPCPVEVMTQVVDGCT